MERAIIDKQKEIDDRTPDFEELEKFFENRTNEYDLLKRSIASMLILFLFLLHNVTQVQMVKTLCAVCVCGALFIVSFEPQ